MHPGDWHTLAKRSFPLPLTGLKKNFFSFLFFFFFSFFFGDCRFQFLLSKKEGYVGAQSATITLQQYLASWAARVAFPPCPWSVLFGSVCLLSSRYRADTDPPPPRDLSTGVRGLVPRIQSGARTGAGVGGQSKVRSGTFSLTSGKVCGIFSERGPQVSGWLGSHPGCCRPLSD